MQHSSITKSQGTNKNLSMLIIHLPVCEIYVHNPEHATDLNLALHDILHMDHYPIEKCICHFKTTSKIIDLSCIKRN